MRHQPTQEFLFAAIRQRIGQTASLADVVADSLCISQDSAYRRIRGETPLVLDEAATLCRRFAISMDSLWQTEPQSMLFRKMDAGHAAQHFAGYLVSIRAALQQLASAQQATIYYLTVDLPFFYQLCFPSLLAFRYFFWMKTTYQHPDFAQRSFAPHHLPADVQALAAEVLRLYCQIPSVEIWNAEALNGLLKQLAYYCETGVMTTAQANEVCGDLRRSIEHLQQQAAHGCKCMPGQPYAGKKENFRLFHNRMGLGDNTILTVQDKALRVYLNYDALNYISTEDPGFCNSVYQQLHSTMSRSTLLSQVSEKQRNMFFNALHARLPQPMVALKK